MDPTHNKPQLLIGIFVAALILLEQSPQVIAFQVNSPPTFEQLKDSRARLQTLNKGIISVRTIGLSLDTPSRSKPIQRSPIQPDNESWFGTVMSFPASEIVLDSPDELDSVANTDRLILVHPPRHNGSNQFSFVVENTTTTDAGPFVVHFSTPNDVSILEVFPAADSASPQSAQIKFESLAAGQKSMVHLLTTPSSSGSFEFNAQVKTAAIETFQVMTSPVDSTRKNPNQPNNPFQLAASRKRAVEVPRENLDLEFTNVPGELTRTEPAIAPHPTTNEFSSPGSQLSNSLTGPETLTLEGSEAFEIKIKNLSAQPATNIIVQVSLPDALIISQLDRQAWMDEGARTVSWKVNSIQPGDTETIHYQIKALKFGHPLQAIKIGMNNQLQGTLEVPHNVIAAQH